MRFQYLGTAASEGWPALFCGCEACETARREGGKNVRTRPQALIDDSLLLDFGPDTYLHALYRGLDLRRVRSVLVTHSHADHFCPQEMILRGEPYAFDDDRTVMTVYGNAWVKSRYDLIAGQSDSQNLAQRVRCVQANPYESFTTADGYEVTPLLCHHDLDEPCLIYLVSRDSKTVLYAHDTGIGLPEETWEALRCRHIDLASLDCTNLSLKGGAFHMGLPDNIEFRRRLLEMGCADERTVFVCNHFSHNIPLTHAQFEAIAAKEGFRVAWDGMTLTL